MSKILGIVTAPTLGGVDYQLTKITAKVEQEKIEYVAMGASGGWKTTFYGGSKSVSGAFEGAADTGGIGTSTAPFTDAANVNFSIGSVGLSFAAVITDVEIEQSNTGLVTVKGNYQSTGTVTGVS